MSATTDRTRPPLASPARPVRLPEFERRLLANGLELAFARRDTVPLVTLELLLPAGGEHNPPGMPGLAQMTASLIDEGTLRRSGPALSAELERRGGALHTASDWSSASIHLALPASEIDFGLELLAELLLEPAFPLHELERLRRRALAELARRIDQPAALAEEAFARRLYAHTVFGELLIGNASSLAAMTRDDIVRFHGANHRTAGARLVVAGDFDPDHVERAVELLMPPSDATESLPLASIQPPPRRGVSVTIVDRPRAAQTELRIGHVGIPRTHPDRTGLGFANTILGGKFTSRINLNLRERHGITYGANSRLVDRRSAGPFAVSCAVSNEAVGLAATEILFELRRLRDEPVGAEEMNETRSYLLGIFPYGLQTVEGLAARLRDIALFGLPLDHPARVLAEQERLTSEDVSRVANAHLDPRRCLIVAAGPGEELVRQLEPFGPIELVTPEDGTSAASTS